MADSGVLFLLVIAVVMVQHNVALPLTSDNIPRAACGYESCPVAKPGLLNVHILAHTHDDAGWLKTMDQYYYGGRQNIQHAGVQYILDSVIQELIKDPNKRFIYVETSFLWKWWQEQDDITRAQFQQLVDNGQMEITSGAWSMNDEAVTHYTSIIDQFTWGLRVLNDTLGECARPRIGWQIDPFGHSREMASILARLGFDGLFFGRLDHQDKDVRLQSKTAEMIWHGSPYNLGDKADIFTHAMYNFYFSPPGFCFDIYCNDDPMIDNKKSHEYNIPVRVQEFLDFVAKQAAGYKTNNVMVTMGGDFHYQGSHFWFKNLDKLIRYVNELQVNGSKVNAFYSTPSCYLKAVNEADDVWPTKSDDFFPYGSEDHAYWSGYFTSKPTIKYFERLGNNFLQVAKQVSSLAGNNVREEGITELRQAMGILQHHDAITGTMKDHVAKDYARILHDAIQEAGLTGEAAINRLLYAGAPTLIPIISCLKLNISECPISETSDSFVVTMYNPLSHLVTQYVRLPVPGPSYSVKDPKGTELTVQLVPIHSSVLSLAGRDSTAIYDLVFQATDLPALGMRSFYVTKLAREDFKPFNVEIKEENFGNEKIRVTLNDDGTTRSININNVDISLQQSYGYYLGFYKEGKRASGAYIFRPNSSEVVDVVITNSVIYKGDLVEEAHQVFGDGWISQVIRVYKGDNHVEFEWMVGPIPDKNDIGKEVITRFQTDLQTNSVFYTDSNGREMIQRQLNYRPTWSINVTEPIASNYYPITSKIQIVNEARAAEVTVLVDRAQGGSSLNDGQIELMIHRRLFHDDGYGVDENLNEQAYGVGLVARGKHYLSAGPLQGVTPTLAYQERLLALQKLLQPWTLFSPTGGSSFQQWADKYSMEYSGLQQSLPSNVHILTLEPWSEDRLLLRLEHILEKSDDPLQSTTVTINLLKLFSHFTVASALETTLGGNQELNELQRLQWRSQGQAFAPKGQENTKVVVDITAVKLAPMEIRTFIVTLVAEL